MFDVWGAQGLPSREAGNLVSSTKKLRNLVAELSNMLSCTEKTNKPLLCRVGDDIEIIHRGFEQILHHLEERVKCPENTIDSYISSVSKQGVLHRATFDYSKAGKLLPIHCGHSGLFTQEEKYHYERHLVNVHFIQ